MERIGEQGENYHVFIVTDKKMYEGCAQKQDDNSWIIGVNKDKHPNVDEKQLLTEMKNILVDVNQTYGEKTNN